MKEIVDLILQEEEAARKRIEHAQHQAEDIVLKAKEEAQSLIRNTVDKANESAKQKIEGYENQFLSDKDKILKETRDKTALLRSKKEKDISDIAGKVFLKVITIKD